jgi:hypothetical protein
MSHLFVLGASGRTGSLVVDYALAEGHTVTALVRDPSTVLARPGLTRVTGTPARPRARRTSRPRSPGSPTMPLRYRCGYAADFPRSLPGSSCLPPREFPAQ